jgi:hypothetical protein
VEERGNNGKYLIFPLQSWTGLSTALVECGIDFNPLLALSLV